MRNLSRFFVTVCTLGFFSHPGVGVAIQGPGSSGQMGQGLVKLPDLDVSFIHRNPAYPYDRPKNAPSRGQLVRFVAHVNNAGSEGAPAFRYGWYEGHRLMSAGMYRAGLEPGQETSFVQAWNWRLSPHRITFRVYPGGAEVSDTNNSLAVRTDALALGYWVEASAYKYFHDFQWMYCRQYLCAGSNSFADWLQRQVSAWNTLLVNSVFPDVAPTGIADRVRLDRITIVPDGSLPLHGGKATNTPDASNRTEDLQWGLAARGVAQVYRLDLDTHFDVDWALIHELNHARSLADLYRFDVPIRDLPNISIRAADGRPITNAANPYDPASKLTAFDVRDQTFLYVNQEQDLMSCACTPHYSPYSVLTLNRIRGRRPICGNSNPPCNLGDWFGQTPSRNLLRVLDGADRGVSDGTVVRVYRDQGTTYTAHRFDEAHVSTLAIRHGLANLGSDPFGVEGSKDLAGHNLLLIEVRTGADDRFCFQEPAPLNMAFWFGYRNVRTPAIFTLRMGSIAQNACNVEVPPALVNEPFSTSPFRSTIRVGAASGKGSGATRLLTVALVDDDNPSHAMRARNVTIWSSRRRLAGPVRTDRHGTATFRVPARAQAIRVLDATDNNLWITSQLVAPPR